MSEFLQKLHFAKMNLDFWSNDMKQIKLKTILRNWLVFRRKWIIYPPVQMLFLKKQIVLNVIKILLTKLICNAIVYGCIPSVNPVSSSNSRSAVCKLVSPLSRLPFD